MNPFVMNAMPSEAARGGALKRPGVRWASMLEHVVFVETEFGLPADASEREKRAHLAGLERAKLRREAIANGAGAVARKPEGKGRLCKSTDALQVARPDAQPDLSHNGAGAKSVSAQATMTLYGMPRFLRKLKTKHAVMAKFEIQKRAFAITHHIEVDSISPAENVDACWQCGETTGRLVDIQHESSSMCMCKIHEACLTAWTREYETKGKRVRICPVCRCKRKGWQPTKYPARLCGAVITGGVCKKRLGHLGNCV